MSEKALKGVGRRGWAVLGTREAGIAPQLKIVVFFFYRKKKESRKNSRFKYL